MKFNPKIRVYGDLEWRGKCPKENIEQVTFFNQIRKKYPDTYGKIAVHTRNEGKRTEQQTMFLKIEGMVTGASDVFIPGNPSFVCEIKRQDHTQSHWQNDQESYLLIAQDLGSFACVALGYEAALQSLEEWINGTYSRQ